MSSSRGAFGGVDGGGKSGGEFGESPDTPAFFLTTPMAPSLANFPGVVNPWDKTSFEPGGKVTISTPSAHGANGGHEGSRASLRGSTSRAGSSAALDSLAPIDAERAAVGPATGGTGDSGGTGGTDETYGSGGWDDDDGQAKEEGGSGEGGGYDGDREEDDDGGAAPLRLNIRTDMLHHKKGEVHLHDISGSSSFDPVAIREAQQQQQQQQQQQREEQQQQQKTSYHESQRKSLTAQNRLTPSFTSAPAVIHGLNELVDKRMVVFGGFGHRRPRPADGRPGWKTIWTAAESYGGWSKTKTIPREDIERAEGCDYYLHDMYSMGLNEQPKWANPHAMIHCGRGQIGSDGEPMDSTPGSYALRRSSHSACMVHGSYLYVYGGKQRAPAVGRRGGDSIPVNDLWVLDMHARPLRWTAPATVGAAAPRRWGHAAAMVGGNMVVVGGIASGSPLTKKPYLDDSHGTAAPARGERHKRSMFMDDEGGDEDGREGGEKGQDQEDTLLLAFAGLKRVEHNRNVNNPSTPLVTLLDTAGVRRGTGESLRWSIPSMVVVAKPRPGESVTHMRAPPKAPRAISGHTLNPPRGARNLKNWPQQPWSAGMGSQLVVFGGWVWSEPSSGGGTGGGGHGGHGGSAAASSRGSPNRSLAHNSPSSAYLSNSVYVVSVVGSDERQQASVADPFAGNATVDVGGLQDTMGSGDAPSPVRATVNSPVDTSVNSMFPGGRGGDTSTTNNNNNNNNTANNTAPPSLKWEAPLVIGNAPPARCNHAAASHAEGIFFFGGRRMVHPRGGGSRRRTRPQKDSKDKDEYQISYLNDLHVLTRRLEPTMAGALGGHPIDRYDDDGDNGDNKSGGEDEDGESKGERGGGRAMMEEECDYVWAWTDVKVQGSPPSPREGATLANVNEKVMLLYGGWGGRFTALSEEEEYKQMLGRDVAPTVHPWHDDVHVLQVR